MIYKRCIFLRVNIKTTCFGHIWPSSGFMSIKMSLYKLRELRYDVENSHRIIVEIYLCIGGYYATLICNVPTVGHYISV